MIDIYKSYGMYCSLISVLGDRNRSIDGLSGVGPKNMQKYIESGICRNEIQLSTTNPEMISNIFHDDGMKEEFINNYYCTSLIAMYKELSSTEKMSVLNQKRDRYDMNSLVSLNNTRFYNYPLILESLSL